MYDFHKRRRSAEEMVFYHACFKKGQPFFLTFIKRKTHSKYAESRVIQAITNLQSNSSEAPSAVVLSNKVSIPINTTKTSPTKV